MPKGNADPSCNQDIPMLLVGIGKRDITPPVGTPLAGRPKTYPTKDIFNQPLSFNTRTFGQTGDAGELLVQAALQL